MIEPIITCPNCSTEIKLTESLAAPIVQAARKEYEAKVAEKESDFSKREKELRILQKNINDSERIIDERVSEKVKLERASIAADEAKKAKAAITSDLDKKTNELAELQEVLQQRNEKLAEAQKSQADLLKKQRELDDEKRELNLTIEKRGALNAWEQNAIGDWLFGCDICQTVCPFNDDAKGVLPKSISVNAYPGLFETATMTHREYALWFAGTPLTRAKKEGLQRNALIAMAVSGNPRLGIALDKVRGSAQGYLRETCFQVEQYLETSAK